MTSNNTTATHAANGSALGDRTNIRTNIDARLKLLYLIVCNVLALRHGLLPASVGTRQPDAALALNVVMQPAPAPGLRHALSNSFGFGGSNASLVFSLSRPDGEAAC